MGPGRACRLATNIRIEMGGGAGDRFAREPDIS